MLARRGFIRGLLCAPAIIRTPGLLMPAKSVVSVSSLADGLVYAWMPVIDYLPPIGLVVVSNLGSLLWSNQNDVRDWSMLQVAS